MAKQHLSLRLRSLQRVLFAAALCGVTFVPVVRWLSPLPLLVALSQFWTVQGLMAHGHDRAVTLLFGLGALPAGRLGDLWGRRVMMINAKRLDSIQMILLAIEDVTDREKAWANVQFGELNHRVKNMLAVVISIATRPTVPPRDFVNTSAVIIASAIPAHSSRHAAGPGRLTYMNTRGRNAARFNARSFGFWKKPPTGPAARPPSTSPMPRR